MEYSGGCWGYSRMHHQLLEVVVVVVVCCWQRLLLRPLDGGRYAGQDLGGLVGGDRQLSCQMCAIH